MRSLKLLGLAILCGQAGAYLSERLALRVLKTLYGLGWTPIELLLFLDSEHHAAREEDAVVTDLPYLEESHG